MIWAGSRMIFKGATRPAMKLGVPLVPLVTLIALLCMRHVTSKDDQRFRQMFVALKLRLHDRNRRFWRSRSYAPTLYGGASDATPG